MPINKSSSCERELREVKTAQDLQYFPKLLRKQKVTPSETMLRTLEGW